jgi:hypothetical protein
VEKYRARWVKETPEGRVWKRQGVEVTAYNFKRGEHEQQKGGQAYGAGAIVDVEACVASGTAEYNNGGIIVRSKHPLDECLHRSITEQPHRDSRNRIIMIRDCAFSRFSSHIYRDVGEGDSDIDALNVFIHTMRLV